MEKEKFDGAKFAKYLKWGFISIVVLSIIAALIKNGAMLSIWNQIALQSSWAWEEITRISWIFVVISGVILSVLGAYGQFLKNVTKSATIITLIIFIVSLFPFFNFLGILKFFLVAQGAGAIIIFLIFVVRTLWINKVIIGLPILGYYLDIFTFGYDKPKIIYYAGSLTAILIIIRLYYKFEDQLKASFKKIKKSWRLRKIKKEVTKNLKGKTDFEVVSAYFEAIKNSKEDWAKFILEIFEGRINTLKFSVEENIAIFKEIKFAKKQINENFLKAFLTTLENSDINFANVIMSTNSFNYPDSLPILFRISNKKKKIIQNFSTQGCVSLIHPVKKEFFLKEFQLTTQALIFSYKNEWDDIDFLKKLIPEINCVLSEAITSSSLAWNKEDAQDSVYATIKFLQKSNPGLQINWPEIPEYIV